MNVEMLVWKYEPLAIVYDEVMKQWYALYVFLCSYGNVILCKYTFYHVKVYHYVVFCDLQICDILDMWIRAGYSWGFFY